MAKTTITITITVEESGEIDLGILEQLRERPKVAGSQILETIKSDTSSRIPKEKPFKTDKPKNESLDYALKYATSPGEIPPRVKPKKTGRGAVTKKPRICAKCEKEFIPIGNRQKFCSEECGLKPKSEKEKQIERMRAAMKAGQQLKKDFEHFDNGKGTSLKKTPPPKPPKPRKIKQKKNENSGRNKGETVSTDDLKMINCAMCGTSFIATAPNDKFCGARCEAFFRKESKKQEEK